MDKKSKVKGPKSKALSDYAARNNAGSSVHYDGAKLIAAERCRQINQEGWSAEHDDALTGFQLALAASSYAALVTSPDKDGDENGKSRPCWDWPWAKKWWKPSDDPIRNLVKAGALIAAEIDRLQRLAAKKVGAK